MERTLLKELKGLLELIESFKDEISRISNKKEGFNLAAGHLESAITESEEAIKEVIDLVGSSLEDISHLKELLGGKPSPEVESKLNNLSSKLTKALTLLEFQDILAQRLLKVKSFLTDVEKSILKVALLAGIEEKPADGELRKKMEELEWKKEVSQEDVDEIMKQFGL